MPDTGAPWNIPYVESTDLVRDWPAADLASATAVAAGLTSAQYVKQVVFASTSTTVSNATSDYVDSGLTATITPTASTSRIMVVVSQPVMLFSATVNETMFGIRLLRGATVILTSVADGVGPYEFGPHSGTAVTAFSTRAALTFVDAPATTAATVYKTQGRRYKTGTLLMNPADTGSSSTSTITLIEIAA